jgi:hypothetical protein
MLELLRKYMKMSLIPIFNKTYTTSSYGVGIGRAWYSRKACEICSSLVQKKKLKKIYFSSHKLPKQQSTSSWSQGINVEFGTIPSHLVVVSVVELLGATILKMVVWLRCSILCFIRFMINLLWLLQAT